MSNIVNTFLSNEDYSTIIKSVPICTVDIVIFNQDLNKVLLFKRENKPMQGVYFTAGGRLFKNESLEECAVRQAKTELGLDISKSDIKPAGFVNEIFEDSAFGDINYHTLNCFFSYILKPNTELKFDPQHKTFDWFSIDDASLNEFVKYRIEKCLQVEKEIRHF